MYQQKLNKQLNVYFEAKTSSLKNSFSSHFSLSFKKSGLIQKYIKTRISKLTFATKWSKNGLWLRVGLTKSSMLTLKQKLAQKTNIY